MRKSNLVILVILLPLIVFLGCAKKVVKEEPAKEVVKEAAPAPKEAPKPAPAPVAEKPIVEAKRVAVEEAPALKDIHFDFDKYNIRDDAKPVLEKNAEWLIKNKNVKIQIEGHCDERGTSEYNMGLGERRAKSTKDYLVKLGVDANRITTISYGKERPLCTEKNEACWQKNRRSHFVVTSK
ncbi:MAG: peptidoglycan-associated lipoprotein Pal [Nitrospirota bacterium]